MAKTEFNIIDELRKDGIGPTPWKSISGKPFTDNVINKEALPEQLQFGYKGKGTIYSGAVESSREPSSVGYFPVAIPLTTGDLVEMIINGQNLGTLELLENNEYYCKADFEYNGSRVTLQVELAGTAGRSYLYAVDSEIYPIQVELLGNVTTPISDEYISENIARVADILDEGVVKRDVLPEQLRFGSEVEKTSLIDETTIGPSYTNNLAFGISTYARMNVDVAFDMQTGSPTAKSGIVVVFDGVVYRPTFYADFVEGAYYYYYGNFKAINGYAGETGNGEPFAIANHSGNEDGIYVIDGSTSHTVEVYQQETAITPIDSDYLPKATAIADVTDAPTAENFNALLASLRAAGYLAQ